MVDTPTMCRRHLLGEHVELHMLVGCILKGKCIDGYFSLVEVHNIRRRHTEISREMKRRGYNHKSSLPDFRSFKFGEVDTVDSLYDLHGRCQECEELYWRCHGK